MFSFITSSNPTELAALPQHRLVLICAADSLTRRGTAKFRSSKIIATGSANLLPFSPFEIRKINRFSMRFQSQVVSIMAEEGALGVQLFADLQTQLQHEKFEEALQICETSKPNNSSDSSALCADATNITKAHTHNCLRCFP
jgi:hypothetical protein